MWLTLLPSSLFQRIKITYINRLKYKNFHRRRKEYSLLLICQNNSVKRFSRKKVTLKVIRLLLIHWYGRISSEIERKRDSESKSKNLLVVSNSLYSCSNSCLGPKEKMVKKPGQVLWAAFISSKRLFALVANSLWQFYVFLVYSSHSIV